MKKEIHKAYETIKPDEAAKERMLSNILNTSSRKWSVETEFPSGTHMPSGKRDAYNIKKQNITRSLQFAAALALILTIPAAAAYATNFLGLRDMHIGQVTIEDPITEVTEQKADIISLQGMSDSPEAMACAEWTAFCEEYDKDGQILSEIGNEPTGIDEKYDAYSCYTQEMADKADEISKKYHLSLLTGIQVADTYEDLCIQSGSGDVCGGDAQNVSISAFGGCYYDNGAFHFDGEAMVNGPSKCKTDFQFSYSVKGTFCPYFLNVKDIENYEQWKYTTANGDTVFLANSDSKALIIVDKKKSFIVVNLLGDILEGKFEITNEALEELADAFLFSSVR